jgi:hypothetical protein
MWGGAEMRYGRGVDAAVSSPSPQGGDSADAAGIEPGKDSVRVVLRRQHSGACSCGVAPGLALCFSAIALGVPVSRDFPRGAV